MPDGDHVDVSTTLWAGDAMKRIATTSESYTAEIRALAAQPEEGKT